MERLGTGIGWRPEIADAVERMPGIDWVEAVAENLCPGHLPESLLRLRERGVTVVPHGVSLGLGGADRPDEARLAGPRRAGRGARLAARHRAHRVRTRGRALDRLAARWRPGTCCRSRAPGTRSTSCARTSVSRRTRCPFPLAVENIAALISWPGEEMTEGQFLYDLVDRTGVRLLIDVANLHTNHVNRGEDPAKALDELPVEAIAYVHVAGGFERDGVWHDSHAHPVPRPVLDILADLASRVTPPGVLLERDENFPEPGELERELASDSGDAGAGGRSGPEELAPGADRASRHRRRHRRRSDTDPARQRLALAQTALLSALVAGTPVPEGFDRVRLGVQARALAAKRADVVAKVAPELPEILAEAYRPAFLAYAQGHPMTGGYRRDALDFAEHLLARRAAPRTRRPGGGCATGGWSARARPRCRGTPRPASPAPPAGYCCAAEYARGGPRTAAECARANTALL